MNSPPYGMVGRGRLAMHLARYLELEDEQVVQWHRGCSSRPADVLSDIETVLLAVSDDALETFVADHPDLRNRRLVHFSGSLTITGVRGLHPLMTFGPEVYELDVYRSIPFVEEAGVGGFSEIFPRLVNPVWSIDPGLKPLYHALCVLAGNFTTVLWLKAMTEFENRLGLPREVLRPYLERTAANTLDQGPAALTGSLARGERGTIERDLDGLGGDPFHGVYLAVARAAAAAGIGS